MAANILQADANGVRTITFNRPEVRNALSDALLAELIAALRQAQEDPSVRVVVLTGAGDQAFCSGVDLNTIRARPGTWQQYQQRQRYIDVIELLWHYRKPTLAAVNGTALGGGLGICLACDLAVSVPHAKFGTPEIKVGLMPLMVMPVLQRHVGRKRAMEMIYFGQVIDAEEALALGMINRIVPLDALAETAQQMAETIAGYSASVLGFGRIGYQEIDDMEMRQALRHVLAVVTSANGLDDAVEGVSAFLDKRSPTWRHR